VVLEWQPVMTDIVVRPVRAKADERRFIDFIYTHYRGYPHWVPPLRIERRKLIDTRKNPFYLHAERELFLAERAGRVVGRIGAIVNHNHNRRHDDRVGFFGFFESVDDQEVAAALVEAAKGFLRSRGLNAMRGPASPSVNDEYGLLIEGFDVPPAVMMPYNPPYYAALLEGCGLRKAKDLYAYLGSTESTLAQPKIVRANEILKKRSGLTYRSLDMKNFAADIERIKQVYNRAWQGNWGEVPMTGEEYDALARDLKPIVRPELVVIAETAGGAVAGFGLALPDINIALAGNRGGGLLRGLWLLLTRRSRIDCCRILVLGVLPEYKRTGAAGVLFYELAAHARELGFRQGEASWILEDNLMMIRAAETMQGRRCKTYRIYEMAI
jgi:GNAT superfamily N-acetyltransferase